MRTVHIYALTVTNDPSTVWYVGKTVDLTMRRSVHRGNAKYKQTSHLHKWIKSLMDNGLDIELKTLETCPEDQWESREMYYIDLLRQQGHPLMNKAPGGRSMKGINLTNPPCNPRKVEMLDKITEEKIRQFDSVSDAAVFLGKDKRKGRSRIIACARGHKNSMYGYKWKYANDK